MSIFGKVFRLITFGESHSSKVGCIIEGFPSNFPLDLSLIQKQLNRRRPGQSLLTTPRDEKDMVSCVSGLQNGRTLGSPLCFEVNNENIRKKDYDEFSNVPRPGHADFTYLKKYGIKAESGGGRSSARETVGRVIGGAVAKQYLQTKGIEFSSWVSQVKDTKIPDEINESFIERKIKNMQIEGRKIIQIGENKFVVKNSEGFSVFIKNENGYFSQASTEFNQQNFSPVNLRCPHSLTSVKIYQQILKAKEMKDSLGGIVQGCIYGLPPGLGNPCFDKLPALMSHAMLSIPATKGFQYGSGFKGVEMFGSNHNDMFAEDLSLKTNNSGGTLGGISTGATFHYRVAFKPVSTIGKSQKTHNLDGKEVCLEGKGRHDPCVLPRAPPIVDNMAAVVIMDLLLCQKAGI